MIIIQLCTKPEGASNPKFASMVTNILSKVRTYCLTNSLVTTQFYNVLKLTIQTTHTQIGTIYFWAVIELVESVWDGLNLD